jgi:predicted dehydrogenase
LASNKKIGVGIIGAGMIGNVHINELKKLPELAEVIAISDPFEESAKKRATEHNIPHVYKDHADILKRSDIDLVIICVPNKFHADIAVDSLKAGKHVVLEKPMAIDLAGAKAIVRAHKSSGKMLMLPHQMRWEWVSEEIRKQVELGNLGKVYHAKTTWLRRKGIPGWGSWFTTKTESGGGPLIDIGVHMLDLSFHLMNTKAKPVSVFGATYAELGAAKKGIGTWGTPNWAGKFDVEDFASALIRLDDGSTIQLDVSWALHIDDELSSPSIQVFGTEGGARYLGGKGRFFKEAFERTTQVEITQPANDEGARVRMAKHFLSCLQEGKEPISNQNTGLANMLILDAIYQSGKTGKEVILDWNL